MPIASLRRSHLDDDRGGGGLQDWRSADRARRPVRHRGTETRRPMLAALGVLVVLTCTAGGAEVASHLDHRSGYLAVSDYVAQGSVILPSDLVSVSMTPTTGLTAIPSVDQPTVVGQRATEPLEAGSLLVPDDLSRAAPLPDDQALVGATLAMNQAPTGLAPGASVIVVLSGTGSALGGTAGSVASQSPVSGSVSTSAGAGELAIGTVYAITLPSANEQAASSGDEIVTLEVPAPAAPAVTAASAAGDVSLAEITARVPS